MERIERDVVIVGAGATGLTAATRLQRAGLSVIVLEARDRVGGRLHTDFVNGQMFEIGGQWVSPDQTALLEAIDELGLETYSRYREGDSIYIGSDGVAKRFTGNELPVDESTAAEIDRLAQTIDELVTQVDPAAPWLHPHATEFDRISFEEWLERQSDSVEARDNISMFIAEAMLTKPAHSFSLLQALLMAASAGSFSNLLDPDFILDKRVVGGLQLVPLSLAGQLDSQDLRLEQPVRRIEWSDETDPASASVAVSTDDLAITARRVIVAVPPNLHNRIEFAPNLPRLRQQLQQHQSLGQVIKVHATYSSPFWREDGLSATAFSPYQVVHEAYDNSNFGEAKGTLVGFVSDETADAVFRLSREQRKSRILNSFAAYFGPKALEPEVYFESDWAAEEWTQGAFAASFDLGGLTRYGAAQLEPVGPIRFGSSDLAAEGYQHVDGAIRVGKRLAEETVESLGSK